MCSVPLALVVLVFDTDVVHVVAHAALVAMLLIPVHNGVSDIVSDVCFLGATCGGGAVGD